MKGITRIIAVGLATAGLAACSTVKEMENAIVADSRPPVEQESNAQRDVTVPDLDARQEDEVSLSQVDRLQRENRKLKMELEAAVLVRDEALSERNLARQHEGELVDQNVGYQDLLRACSEKEEKLKSQILQAQIENVRLKQELATQRIRELSAGAGN